jgi:hypothetical protein
MFEPGSPDGEGVTMSTSTSMSTMVSIVVAAQWNRQVFAGLIHEDDTDSDRCPRNRNSGIKPGENWPLALAVRAARSAGLRCAGRRIRRSFGVVCLSLSAVRRLLIRNHLSMSGGLKL